MAEEKKKKKSPFRKTLIFCVIFGVFFGLGLFIGGKIGGDGGDEVNLSQYITKLCVFIAAMYAGMVFHIIIHEGGHLIFGLISGYKFLFFRVFNIMFINEDGRIKIRKYSVTGTAGQCIMLPPEPADGVIPVMLYNLGGAVMNFLWGAIFAILYFVFAGTFSFAFSVFTALSFIGILYSVMNIVPMKNTLGSGVPNDGYNAFMLTKSKEENRAFRFQLLMVAALLKGTRPRDFPAEWQIMPESFKSPFAASIANAVLACFMDKHDFVKAREIAETVLEKPDKIADIFINEISGELLFLELIGECRKDEIEKLYTERLKRYIKASRAQISKSRLIYAYEKLAACDDIAAGRALKLFNKNAPKHPFAGETESERDYISIIDSVSANRARKTTEEL